MRPFPIVEEMETGWMLLGYQFLFVEILQMTSDVLPSPKEDKKRRKAADSLIRIINRAIIGGGIIRRSKRGPYRIYMPLNEAVKAEKAWREMQIILPDGIEEKEKLMLLARLKKICKGLLGGNHSAEEKEFMHEFCHDVLGRLDQERCKLIGY